MNSLRQQLGQRQYLAPQLQQSSAILQMTALELSEMIKTELDSNPFLEHVREHSPLVESKSTENGAHYSESVDFVANLAQDEVLTTRLQAQLPHLHISTKDQNIAMFLIGMLDDHGYLRESNPSLAQMLDVAESDVAAVRQQLQGLDPPALFCTDLVDYLRLQLHQKGLLNPAICGLLDFLSTNGPATAPDLAVALSISVSLAETYLSVLRTLKSHPLADVEQPALPPVQPDILVSGTVTQGWSVELNDEIIPRIFLNSSYYKEMQGQMRAGHDLDFAAGMFNSANWLLRCIAQRSQTLLRVAAVIVQHQRLFLDNKANNLSPLTLADIATELKLHPSTISRATSNKFISAPIGTIRMKTLLTRAVGNVDGEKGYSSQKIKQLILEAINQEDKKTPLSDENICELLSENSIRIARRTVAKYRQQMEVPNSKIRGNGKR